MIGVHPDVEIVANDESLVRAAQAGDRAAFEDLYRRYARMVHGILLARLPVNEVEDLVQDVFLGAIQKLGSLRQPAAFGGWLAAIARNRASDFHRASIAREELTEAIGSSRGESAYAREALGAIRALPEAYRETLILRLVEGYTGPEIAERTGLTPGSVRVNLHRGMQMLREALNK